MYRYLDAMIVRGTAWPAAQQIPLWPDLTGPADLARLRAWLQEISRLPGFTAALEQASPALAGRVQDITAGRDVTSGNIRRAVIAVMQYLLRARGRATPFGLFAGVAPAKLAGCTKVRTGAGHQAVVRPPADWLTAVTGQLESEAALWPRLMLLANNLAFERDGYLIIEHRPAASAGTGPEHVQLRATAPVKAAMRLARTPVRGEDLSAELAAGFPEAPADAASQLLAGLIRQHFLLTSLRPAMTVTDPLGHLLARLREAHAGQIPQTAQVTAQLDGISAALAAHNSAPDEGAGRSLRTRITGEMAATSTAPPPWVLSCDLRLDWDLAIPAEVAEEAARAAGVLAQTAARRTLSPGWDMWHARFLDRYGPGAVVPLLDAVSGDTGLGYPAGYPGGAPGSPPGPLTSRDTLLLTLAQHAALRHDQEIVLTSQQLAQLTPDPPGAVQPSTELTVRIAAASTEAIDRGDFTLTVVSISRMAGTMTGRFLPLLGDGDRDRMTSAYRTRPAASHGAVLVQVSAPPRYAATQDVARSPQVTQLAVSVGEYRDGDGLIPLDDIAVTASRDRIWLTWLSRQKLLEPVILNAVDPAGQLHPLARFLAEAPVAMATPCTAFDWGAAARLPFLPALRHGRTIVSPARWTLTAADLPGPESSWAEWDDALTRWRAGTGLPSAVHLGDGDQRLALDLAEDSHRALLRHRLGRSGHAVLRLAPGEDAGWIGGHAHEIVIPLITAAPPAGPPGCLSAGVASRDDGHLPGQAGRWSVKLYSHPGRQDDILIRHLPRLLRQLPDGTRWWYLRYYDPGPHLRLRLTNPGNALTSAAATIGQWTRELRSAGLIASTEWDTYFPETARFGGRAAANAAETWFAADSAAATAELAAARARRGPDPRALAAASMLAIVADIAGGTAEAATWMITRTRTCPSPPPRALYNEAVTLAGPGGMAAVPGSSAVTAAWEARRQAATAYRDALPAPFPASGVLPDLLHLHHARLIGPDLASEAVCLHLARAAALSWTARKADVT